MTCDFRNLAEYKERLFNKRAKQLSKQALTFIFLADISIDI